MSNSILFFLKLFLHLSPVIIESPVNFIIEQNSKTQVLDRPYWETWINRVKLGKPFKALHCLKENNKSMGNYNFYDRLVFAVEMFSRWQANRIPAGFLAIFCLLIMCSRMCLLLFPLIHHLLGCHVIQSAC